MPSSVLQLGGALKSLQKEATKFIGDIQSDTGFSIGGGSINLAGGKIGLNLPNLPKMPLGRTYVKGWTPHTPDSDVVYRSTIRDTGRGQAQTSDYVPRRPGEEPATYDDIKAQCLKSGVLWEDPDFPPVASSIYFRKPPSAWPNIQWKRPRVCG